MSVEEVLNLNPSSPPLGTDCLYFVAPNNPTGDCPTKEQFANIVEYCAKHKVMLLIDFCFRFFGDFWDYDQYQMMHDAGVEFITTEDTGKSFPAADVKLGMTISSHEVYPYLKDISDDFIFSVARFVLELVTRFIGAEHRENKRLLSQDLADANRKILHETLAGSNLQITNPNHKMGLDWAKLPDGWNATHLCKWLYENGGPQLLPGERFYWSDYDEGSHYVRIALLRNPDYFKAAMDSLCTLTDKYQPAPAPHAPQKSRAIRWSARAHK